MQETLIVPVDLDALAANEAVIRRDSFRWWTFNYNALSRYKSAEPLAFNQYVGGQKPGVYLHWVLPRALRTGFEEKNAVRYPLVPNRWLVIRRGSDTTKSWVLESDCPTCPETPPETAAQTSAYLIDPGILAMWKDCADSRRKNANISSADPHEPITVNLGIPFPLENWHEQASETMFLTALAPSNAEFSIYVAHNRNIFSFYDDLAGIDKDTLSYFVAGWYSDPGKDVVRTGPRGFTGKDTQAEVLETLGWSLTEGEVPQQIERSIYSGSVFSIAWERAGVAPQDDPLEEIRQSKKLNVAVGNNTVDAFSALLASQLSGYQDAGRTAALLRAFQYNLLHVLDEPGGEAMLDKKVRDAWFSSRPGGYRWELAARRAEGGNHGGKELELAGREEDLLLRLNADQNAYEREAAELVQLQWDLHAAWWKKGHLRNIFPNQTGYRSEDFDGLLDAANPASLLSRVRRQLEKVDALAQKLPRPLPEGNGKEGEQAAFLRGIEAFAQRNSIDPEKQLKAVAKARYWQGTDPVMVIAGVQPAKEADPGVNLNVRLGSQLITGFSIAGIDVEASRLVEKMPPLPNREALPGAAADLFVEFLLLDPASAQLAASLPGQSVDALKERICRHNYGDYRGVLPQKGLEQWSQPWSPIFMEWRVRYIHVPHEAEGKKNWLFDGIDYILDDNAAGDGKIVQIGGISPLSTHIRHTFKERLREFISGGGESKGYAQLDEWMRKVDGWCFVSQELTGFRAMLAQRDARTFRAPGGGMKEAVADTVPFLLNDVLSDFYGICQGQIFFTDLMLYDKFGRVLDLTRSETGSGLYKHENFPLLRDAAMLPPRSLQPAVTAPAQLPPRLLQHMRLEVLLSDQRDDSMTLGESPRVNPICGWILMNHLDHGLLLYAPGGSAMGELRLQKPAPGEKRVVWSPPVNGEIRTLLQIREFFPHLGAFIAGLAGRGEAEFFALLETIDRTMWTLEPLRGQSDLHLSLLVGRPLALVRAGFRFQLEGPPLIDAGWQATFAPVEPPFLKYSFSLRLGDLIARNDGTIGYFTGNDYTCFHSVAVPPPHNDYVCQIGPPGRPQGNYLELQAGASAPTCVTLLVDPRSPIHAFTGLLPVKDFKIPARFFEQALKTMEASFHAGPLLTKIIPVETTGEEKQAFQNTVAVLPPAEQNGTWSWWEKERAQDGEVQWHGYGLRDASPDARMENASVSLREGILQLIVALNEEKK